MSKGFKNIFLVSSALQSITVFLLLKRYAQLRDNSIVFLEEGTALFPQNYGKVVVILSTRNNRKFIKRNFEEINKYISGNTVLWVSDLFWPMNNFLYSRLLRSENLLQINFFDEGMVLYWRERVGLVRFIREALKSTVLKVQLGDYSYLSTSPFFGAKKLGQTHAYHKDLLMHESVKEIGVESKDLEEFRTAIGIENLNIPASDFSGGVALFLAGPYYRLSSHSEFSVLLKKLVSYLNECDLYNLVIKLHPTESNQDYLDHYHYHGFKLIDCASSIPVEAYADLMGGIDCIVGFNSSALLNLRKFGFKGKLVSFGLDYMAKLAKFDSHLTATQKKIFGAKDVVFRDIL